MQLNPSNNKISDLVDGLMSSSVYKFLREHCKTIFSFTILGLVVSTLFFFFSPKQYEAFAQFKMAQISNGIGSNNLNTTTINVEDPQVLISRMASPTTYSKEIIELCGMADIKDADAVLAKKARFTAPRGTNSIIELRISGASREIAFTCANAIFQLIKSYQALLIAPYINDAMRKISNDQERLNKARHLIANADKSGDGVTSVYLATRDEIRYLLDQITNMEYFIASSESRKAQLTAPIYSLSESISPKILKNLFIGFVLGGLLGFLVSLVRLSYRFFN